MEMDYGDWNNPPLVMDSEMSVEDAFEAFVNHPEDNVEQSSFFTDSFNSPLPGTPSEIKSHLLHNASSTLAHQQQPVHQPLSIASSTSPESSSQDSSSDSSRRRKRDTTFSTSSPGRTSLDVDMRDNRWLKQPSPADSLNPGSLNLYAVGHDMNKFTFQDQTQLDTFHHPASSPDRVSSDVHDQTIAPSSIDRRLEQASSQEGAPNSLFSKTGFILGGSRDSSPADAFSLPSQQGSPLNFYNGQAAFSPKHVMNTKSFTTLDTYPGTPTWSPSPYQSISIPAASPQQLQSPSSMGVASPSQNIARPKLTIAETSNKSRVETQINIAFILQSPPEGVQRLHLPTHTISKVKLLAKSREKRPDTLELHSMLVCASAMQKPMLKNQALRRAAGLEPMPQSRRSSAEDLPDVDDENDPCKPLNGGEVKICSNCINRERKRSTRKKAKKQEDEETWNERGCERVILFNEKEYQDWRVLEQPEGTVMPGAFRIDVPMRITCYCRHHNEKNGFQAIFTLKDHEGRLVAQAMTRPILITDDHKTQTPAGDKVITDAQHAVQSPEWPKQPQQTHHVQQVQQNLQPSQIQQSHQITPTAQPPLPQPSQLPQEPPFMSSIEGTPAELERLAMQQALLSRPMYSYSVNDLPSMRNPRGQGQMPMPPRSKGTGPVMAHSAHQRNLSRQASPSAHAGPNKKRKSSSSHQRIPSGLTMTRVDTGAPSVGPLNASSSVPISPYIPDNTSLGSNGAGFFVNSLEPKSHQQGSFPHTPANQTGNMFSPTTNHSMNLDNMHYYSVPNSVPNSAHASRATSPASGSRQKMGAFTPQQKQPGFGPGMHSMGALQANQALAGPAPAIPTIHKLTPVEGPLTGGIEVACFGVGFDRTTEVLFGDVLATTTTYWGPNTLTCLLPPSASAGTVAVTVRTPSNRGFPNIPLSNSTTFRYFDDTVNKLIVMALRTIADKKTGNENNAVGFLLKIAESKEAWEGFGSSSDAGQVFQSLQVLGLDNSPQNLTALENNLLKLLDAIDLDDSPHAPNFDLQQENGGTMLSLACGMGLTRFVAALLARGCDPDIRDICGFTPLMIASMHGHAMIVRKLVSKGADPTCRSLQGYRASDLAKSDQVLDALQETHYRLRRSRSTGTLSYRSRASSMASLSAWESVTQSYDESVCDDDDDEVDDVEECDATSSPQMAPWVQSRRGSFAVMNDQHHQLAAAAPPHQPGLLAPAAAMNAWRNQLVAQIHQFQQSVNNWNFPQFQIPTLPPLPQLPQLESYQDHPMVRKISSLVPQRASADSTCSSSEGTVTGEHPRRDYSSWFSLSPSPPPYEEVCPNKVGHDQDSKKDALYHAAVDHVVDEKCATMFDTATTITEKQATSTAVEVTEASDVKVRVWSKSLTKEAQEQLRAQHAQNSKRLSNDRRLFFCWIPLMIVIAIAMFTDWFHYLYTAPGPLASRVPSSTNQRIVEV